MALMKTSNPALGQNTFRDVAGANYSGDYGGAIDVPTLKAEQARIGNDLTAAQDRLADLDANLSEWQEILELAATLATRCGDAYRKACDRTRKQFNAAVLERLDVKDGRICREQYRPPFDDIFSVCEFEYETRVEVAGIEPASSGFSTGLLRAQPVAGSRDRFRNRRQDRSPADLGCPRRPVGTTAR